MRMQEHKLMLFRERQSDRLIFEPQVGCHGRFWARQDTDGAGGSIGSNRSSNGHEMMKMLPLLSPGVPA